MLSEYPEVLRGYAQETSAAVPYSPNNGALPYRDLEMLKLEMKNAGSEIQSNLNDWNLVDVGLWFFSQYEEGERSFHLPALRPGVDEQEGKKK